METTLHRQLKTLYADAHQRIEVPLANYRIDAMAGDELVEIQHGSLAAIRTKVASLLNTHQVRVVKPLVVARMLVKRRQKGGRVDYRRLSPKHGSLWQLFDELVYFTRVFPHPRLTLEVPLVDVEEWRYPTAARRRRNFRVEDQKLLAVHHVHYFRTAGDLAALLPPGLPVPFHTGHLSDALHVPRFLSQRIAYCLLHTGATHLIGRLGNARLYQCRAAQTDAA
jgi:hypothetical protein